MAAIDPLKNEIFNEELEAYLNHAVFLREQIQRIREKLQSLQKLNETDDPIEENVKNIRQLQLELVNLVKDLDESTKKIATIFGSPVVDIENIELNQYDTEKHSIYPIPNKGIGILNKVPKILAPVLQGIRYGRDENIDDENGNEDLLKQKSNSQQHTQNMTQHTAENSKSDDEYLPAGSCGWNYENCMDLKNDIKNMVVDNLQSNKNGPEDQGKDCYKQLAIKDSIIKSLRDKLRDRQNKLRKLNGENRKLDKHIKKNEENTDEELTSEEFVEKYMQRLEDKMKRTRALENFRKEADNAKEKKIIQERLNYIQELENAEDVYERKLLNNLESKRIPDSWKDCVKMSQLQKLETIEKLKHYEDIKNEFEIDGREYPRGENETNGAEDNSGADKTNGKKFLRDRVFNSNEDRTATNNDVEENRLHEMYNLGRKSFREALGKCCKNEDQLTEQPDPIDSSNTPDWTEEDTLKAFERIGLSQMESKKATHLLRTIEERQGAIRKMERQIQNLQRMVDSGDIVRMVHSRLGRHGSVYGKAVPLLANKSNKSPVSPNTTLSTNSITFPDDAEHTLNLLKAKRAEETNLKNQCQIAKRQEAQAAQAAAVLEDEMAKRKHQQIEIQTHLRLLKERLDQMKNQNACADGSSPRVETLEERLIQITSDIRQKREEFGDKKILVEKLNAHILELEHTMAKRTLC